MLSLRGCCVSQTVRAQGGGFRYILVLSFTHRGEFAQSDMKTWAVRGTAPAPVARQQQKMNVVNTDICPILSRFVIKLS